jgi:DNA-binding GntR family transcriptional regulator
MTDAGVLPEDIFRLPKRVAMAATVADEIAWAVAAGHLNPGEKLNETELGERMGVSRVPIREALKILHAQGIVTGEQNRGYRVAAFDDKTIRDVLEVRVQLETILLRDAILSWRARRDMATALDAPLAALQDAADKDDRAASLAADLAFHRAIAESSGNEISSILWEAIARHVLIIFSRHDYRDDDLNAVVRQHKAFKRGIVDMIKSDADAESIRKRLEDHLLQVARARSQKRA